MKSKSSVILRGKCFYLHRPKPSYLERNLMAAELRWDDVEDLGIALADKYPGLESAGSALHRYAPLHNRTAHLR